MENLKQIPEKYVALGVLLLWGGLFLTLGLVRFDAYGIDEGAARALILNWSVADNIINPIFVLGAPDFRALLFAPIGIYWSGNMIAAKVFSILITFFAAWLLYRWIKKLENGEVAIVATALFLISPVVVQQVDSMGAGPYLLLAFALGAWLDAAYRKSPIYFGGWYFLQLVWIAVVVTIHPIGLAYPLALAYWWFSRPQETKQSRHVYVGIFIATVIAIAMTLGWHDLSWFNNPFTALSTNLQGGIIGSAEDINWVPGIISAFVLSILLFTERTRLSQDFLGLMILISIVIGIFLADSVWATFVFTMIIYSGTARLAGLNQDKTSFIGQKGTFITVIFISLTFFMVQAKTHAIDNKLGILSPEDELLQTLSRIASDETKPFRAASEWPGRAMLATRRDVLPLPPAFESAEELYEKAVSGVTHILFNPYARDNAPLAQHLANLVGYTETSALNRVGALITVTQHKVTLHTRLNEAVAPEEKKETETSTQ